MQLAMGCPSCGGGQDTPSARSGLCAPLGLSVDPAPSGVCGTTALCRLSESPSLFSLTQGRLHCVHHPWPMTRKELSPTRGPVLLSLHPQAGLEPHGERPATGTLNLATAWPGALNLALNWPGAVNLATTWPGVMNLATTWPGVVNLATTWPGALNLATARPSSQPCVSRSPSSLFPL